MYVLSIGASGTCQGLLEVPHHALEARRPLIELAFFPIYIFIVAVFSPGLARLGPRRHP